MDWRQEMVKYASDRGLTYRLVPGGIGIDFGNGCDAFWLLPGEIFSTLPIPSDGPSDLSSLISEFERIEKLRERALHVIRHYLASKKFYVDLRRSGQWGVMTPEGMTDAPVPH